MKIEFAHIEVSSDTDVMENRNESQLQDLTALQLAVVGGGSGEVGFA